MALNGAYDLFYVFVARHDLQFDLHREIYGIVHTAKAFPMPPLASAAAHIGDRHASYADLTERDLDLVEFEWADDGFYLFHAAMPPLRRAPRHPSNAQRDRDRHRAGAAHRRNRARNALSHNSRW